MKKNHCLISALLIFCSVFSFINLTAQKKTDDLNWLKNWFDAWEMTSKEILALPPMSAPELLFFDDSIVISTSDVSAPVGKPIDGPKFFGRKLPWKIMEHKGKLTLPDGQTVPLGLMSFAGPLKNGKSFFVMAAPSFWKAAGVTSAELNLDRLLTGVFLHEFAHVSQTKGFGALIDSIDGKHFFSGVEINDDMVQDYFKYDTNYIRHFKLEVSKFYEAAFSSSDQNARSLIQEGLELLVSRQQKYFTAEKEVLKELDDIFLSMEGIGQYVAVAWLIHPKGGNLPVETAVKGFRRNGKQWSQEEGLALFLALSKLVKPDWRKEMFSEHPTYITDLLRKAVEDK
ncbi:MAG TPA: hypothetical protein VGD17_00905 [Chitinophagaceae bacterium]